MKQQLRNVGIRVKDASVELITYLISKNNFRTYKLPFETYIMPQWILVIFQRIFFLPYTLLTSGFAPSLKRLKPRLGGW